MAVDYAALKKGGFMRQKQRDCFSMRLHSVGGFFTAEQMEKIVEVANKYGEGYIHLTARQGIEIPYIRLQQIEEVKAELAKAGVEQGACGPRVRTVTACQGSATCPSGLIETQGLAKKLDERFFRKDLPHKFKIGLTGCRNNCLKAEENDLGIKGSMKPEWDASKCSGCGLCEAVCPAKCIQVDKEAKRVTLNEDACIYCGRCVKSCPEEARQGKSGYLLYFGGMFGKDFHFGRPLLPILFEEETVLRVADATIAFYKENGQPSERFAKMLDRIGIEKLREKLREVIE